MQAQIEQPSKAQFARRTRKGLLLRMGLLVSHEEVSIRELFAATLHFTHILKIGWIVRDKMGLQIIARNVRDSAYFTRAVFNAH